MRDLEEELRMEKAQLAARVEHLKEQEKILEEKMMRNSRKLVSCLWVLIVIFFLLVVSELRFIQQLPPDMRPIPEMVSGYGKWIVAGAAVSIYLIAVYMGWFTTAT